MLSAYDVYGIDNFLDRLNIFYSSSYYYGLKDNQ